VSLSGWQWLSWLVWTFLLMGLIGMGYGWISLRHRVCQLEEKLQQLTGMVDITSDSGIGVGRKVISLERRLLATQQKQQEIESCDLQKVTYDEAVRMISAGADADDLIKACGITQPEADLLKTLHASQTTAQTKET